MERRRSSIEGSGSSVPSSPAATRARASASADARRLASVRRAAWVTRTEITVLTATKPTRAATFSVSEMVNVWIGWVKNQLSATEPATAAVIPGPIPPTVDASTTSIRKAMRSPESLAIM